MSDLLLQTTICIIVTVAIVACENCILCMLKSIELLNSSIIQVKLHMIFSVLVHEKNVHCTCS